MVHFEKVEEDKKRAREEELNEEGWTTVKRKKVRTCLCIVINAACLVYNVLLLGALSIA